MSGLIANEYESAGSWSGAPVDTITLDYDARFRRRVLLTCDSGAKLLLDLAAATVLRDGDGLVTEAGIVAVKAAPEALIEIRCESPEALVCVAWHIGNRHLPMEAHGDRLLIRDDHVIADMLERLGARIRRVRASFDPLSGAYAHGHSHDQP